MSVQNNFYQNFSLHFAHITFNNSGFPCEIFKNSIACIKLLIFQFLKFLKALSNVLKTSPQPTSFYWSKYIFFFAICLVLTSKFVTWNFILDLTESYVLLNTFYYCLFRVLVSQIKPEAPESKMTQIWTKTIEAVKYHVKTQLFSAKMSCLFCH